MPTNRVRIRRDRRDEMAAWSEFFSIGADHFADLDAIGVVEPIRAFPLPGPDRDAAQAAFDRLARDAWRRLGRRFLDQFEPTPGAIVPWALENLGNPGGNE
jgi:hypothetical protein